MSEMSIPNIIEKIKPLTESRKGRDVLLIVIISLASIGSFLLGRASISQSQPHNIIVKFDPNEIAKKGIGDSTLPSPASFGMGQSVSQSMAGNALMGAKNAISGTSAPQTAGSKLGTIVASKRGSKYYFTWCSGANSLSESNKIYFQTEAQAQVAGYTKSTSCK